MVTAAPSQREIHDVACVPQNVICILDGQLGDIGSVDSIDKVAHFDLTLGVHRTARDDLVHEDRQLGVPTAKQHTKGFATTIDCAA